MISVEEQTRIAIDFLTNIGRGGIDRKYYADDMVAWSGAMGFVKLPDYLPKLDIVQKVFPTPLAMKIDNVTAQPGRVVLQSRSHGVLFNGDVYSNEYLFMFEFNDKGQIRHIREYFSWDRLQNILLPAIVKWNELHGKKVANA
jgi:hypothetical protein